MQIVDYKVKDNILLVGFKENNFVVYTQIGYDTNKTKDKLLQQAYKQVKYTVEYERTLDEHSFTTDKLGETFTPETPKPTNLDIDFNNLTGKVLDQYNNIYSTKNITFTIEGTDKAKILNNKIIEDIVEEDTEYHIIARFEGLEKIQKKVIYALVPDKISMLENQLLEVQNYIVNKEYNELIKEGGM